MAWENRPGGLYFYGGVKQNGCVRKTYFGGGLAGQLAAKAAADERARRRALREQERFLRLQYQGPDRLTIRLVEAAEGLSSATLIVAGFHWYYGIWRRRRAINEAKEA